MRGATSHAAACTRVAALFRQRWLRHYVSSKLRSDPVFARVGDVLQDSTEPLLDVGCGVGLLPFYLRERGFRPAILGLDTDARKLRPARLVAAHYEQIEFAQQDVREPLPVFAGNVAVLDVVHYLSPPEQQALLSSLAARVRPGGVLLLRETPRDGSARFWMTHVGECFAQAISWNIGVPLQFPTRAALNAPFTEQEFTRAEEPSWGGTPFNNRLFTFRRRATPVVPAAGSHSDIPAPPAAAKSAPGSAG